MESRLWRETLGEKSTSRGAPPRNREVGGHMFLQFHELVYGTQITPITPISRTGLWYANNELVFMGFLLTNVHITGGAHI